MTICNMTIEGGGRAGMIAPDETTFECVEGRPGAPGDFDAAVERWRELPTDEGAELRHRGRGRRRARSRRWSPGGRPRAWWSRSPTPVPDPARMDSPADREAAERALAYMDLRAGHADDARSRSTGSSSAPAPTRGSRTCARRPSMVDGRKVASSLRGDGRPRLAAGQGAGRGRGPRRGLPLGRLRVARGGLLDVPGDEPRHPAARASAAPRPRTATSRAARARAGAPTWSARRWPRPRRSRAASSTSGSGAEPWTRSR